MSCISVDHVAEISMKLYFSALNSKPEKARMGFIRNYVREAKQKGGKKMQSSLT